MKHRLLTLVLAVSVAGAASSDRPPLYDAAVLNDRAKVDALLARDRSLVHARDRFGFTALHGVAGEHHSAMARLLIARGADVNARNDEGITPLHLAAWPEIVDVLIQAGAQLEARDKQSRTPLMVNAADPGKLDAMQALLRHGVDVSARDARGRTALDIARDVAPVRGDDDKVRVLLGHKGPR
jgi:uncharacterized protein